MRTWKRSTCPADSIYMMTSLKKAPAMRTSTRTLLLQSLVPYCRHEVVTVLRNSNFNVCICERNRNVTALEQSWTEKIPSCGDVVHLAIEDVTPCKKKKTSCLVSPRRHHGREFSSMCEQQLIPKNPTSPSRVHHSRVALLHL